ncbi:MAG: S8 family serine peptidase [Oligoflexales bacterium]
MLNATIKIFFLLWVAPAYSNWLAIINHTSIHKYGSRSLHSEKTKWFVSLSSELDHQKMTLLSVLKQNNNDQAIVQVPNSPHNLKQLKEWLANKKISSYERDTPFQVQTSHTSTPHMPWWDIIHLPEALRGFHPKISPIIAVIDSGVDIEHPMIRDHIWVNPYPGEQFCGHDLYGCDTSRPTREYLGSPNVWPEGTHGYAQKCPLGSPYSSCQHGTHIAGIITGDARNNRPGSCSHCRILVLKVVHHGTISDASVIRALRYILTLKEKGEPIAVVTASFGRSKHSKALGLMMQYLQQRSGPLVVAAAGNDNRLGTSYPSRYPNALTVTAVNSKLHRASYANYGTAVDIAAPGGDHHSGILSAIPGYGTTTMTGTSQAVPIVAGVAGLIYAVQPHLKAEELKHIITTSSKQSLYQIKENEKFTLIKNKKQRGLLGKGLIQAKAALESPPPYPHSHTPNAPLCGGVSLSWLVFFLCQLIFPTRFIKTFSRNKSS